MRARRGNLWRAVAVAAAAAFCIAAASARADGDFAKLLVERRSVYVGRSFTVSVVVKSRGMPDEPVFPPVAALRVGPLVGGTFVSDPKSGARTFQYQFLAREAGTHTVGPVTVSVGGRTLRTRGQTVTVLAPEWTRDAELIMTLSKSACVVGEPVTLKVQWRLAMPLETVKAVDLRLGVLQDPRLDVLDPHVADRSELTRAVGLPVSHTRILAQYGTAAMGDRKCATLTFHKILVPRRAGRIDIAPATVLCTVAPGKTGGGSWRQYPSYFDNDFFKRDPTGRGRVVFATAAGLTLDVAPLPTARRPVNFSGLVWPHAISVLAEPTTVPVGAPVVLTIRITGPCPEAVTLGSLRDQVALARDFRIPASRWLGRIEDGAKVFIRTVRPRGPHVRCVPAIELNWYDPRAAAYRASRSTPIPLTVTGSRAVGAGDIEGGAAAGVRDDLAAEREQLTHFFSAQDVLADLGRGPFSPGGAAWWVALLAVGPCLFAIFAVSCAARRRRRASERAVRAGDAMAAFRKQMADVRQTSLDPHDRWARIEAALRKYLADRRGMTAAAPAELEALLDACQARRFTPGASSEDDWESTAAAAEQMVARIEEALR